MKLRIQSNSVRFRLLKSEVAQLNEVGRVEESITFGPSQKMSYVLSSSATSPNVEARYRDNEVRITIPKKSIERWAASDDVSIEATRPLDAGNHLEILIEKDFKCLDAARPENADAFPHPREGQACE